MACGQHRRIQNLKKGVEDTLKKIPGTGERIVSRLKKTKSGIKQLFVPGMFFEDMGITYLGPVDGHDIKEHGDVCSMRQNGWIMPF